ncbi:hypothetical protein, partial [Pseudomonas syringae]|uniref:hypothetical protein n=1 Tax=Pseudomonas syringae TaxID=317 RepID=UPI001F1FE2A9
MNIPINTAIAIQNDIFILTLDDYPPHGILGGMSTDENLQVWQYSVDVIHRCLVSGLWSILNKEWMNYHKVKDYEFFCKKLSDLNPFNLSDEGETFWLEPLLSSTELSFNLIKKYGISSLSKDLCIPFICEIENNFSANGVSWEYCSFYP